jgi:hypothetical protein
VKKYIEGEGIAYLKHEDFDDRHKVGSKTPFTLQAPRPTRKRMEGE